MMSIGVDQKSDSSIACGARVHIIEVETIWLRVDLEQHAGSRGGGDDPLEIDRGRRALAEQPARRVRQCVDTR